MSALLLVTLILLAIVLVTGLAFLVFFVSKKRIVGSITRSLNMKLFRVTLPREEVEKVDDKAKSREKEAIAVMDQLYSAVSAIRFSQGAWFMPRQYVVFELAIPHVGEEISFYFSVQERLAHDIEKQIYSYFPKAEIAEVEDYNIFGQSTSSLGSYLQLQENSTLPIKTYRELEADPLREITNALSRIEEVGEGAAIQIAFRPAKKRNRQRGLMVSRFLRKGKTVRKAVEEVNIPFVLRLAKSFAPPRKEKKEGVEDFRDVAIGVSEEHIKAVENKASKAQLEVNIRILSSAKNETRAEEVLRQLENAFSQLNNPALNSFRVVRPTGRGLRKLFFNFSYRIFDPSEAVILSVEELTSLYHFPNTVLDTPRIKSAKARVSEPPADLPKTGLIIGRSIYRGEERKIMISPDDRRRHAYIIGQTGTGKSGLLKSTIIQDIRNGNGVGLIDPHGDIAEEVLGSIPESRYGDVVVVDPSDLSRPIGLNMLEYNPAYPEQKTFIVNELMNIFDKLYDLKTTGGPIFEQYTRNALLLLMEYPDRGYTILEIPRVLADKEFRRGLLSECRNLLVKDFWEKEAEKAGGEASLQNLVPYITSKFSVFIANDYLRPIISQSKNTINFREIIDQKKILIVNLTKGRLGDINSSLLGLIIVGKLLMAALSRVDVSENERQDFYLYIDEFQNFATTSISTILSEARKYRLNLVIAHQFIEQLKKEIKDAVFGNVGNLIALRVGATDAEFLEKQFEPTFNKKDLVNIDNFNAYVKILISGKTSKPFSMQTMPPEKTNPELADSLKRLSSLKYGRERALVEQEIFERLRPSSKAGGLMPPI